MRMEEAQAALETAVDVSKVTAARDLSAPEMVRTPEEAALTRKPALF